MKLFVNFLIAFLFLIGGIKSQTVSNVYVTEDLTNAQIQALVAVDQNRIFIASDTKDVYYVDNTNTPVLFSAAGALSGACYVDEESDFPAPVGGIITLDSSKTYVVTKNITIANKIDLNESSLIGYSFETCGIEYTPNSGELFTGSNGGHIQNLTLEVSGGGTAQMFDLNGDAGQLLFVRFSRLNGDVVNNGDLGQIYGDFSIVQFLQTSFSFNSTGLQVDSINLFIINSGGWLSTNTANPAFDFNGDFGEIEIINGDYNIGVGETGFDISGITSIVSGELSMSTFHEGGTYLTGTVTNEWEIDSRGLQVYKDIVAEGELHISTSAATSISTVNTPVKVAGTTTTDDLFRFDDDGGTSNRLRYTGESTREFHIEAVFSVTSAANNKTYSFYFAKNGTVLTNSRQQRKIANGADVGNATLLYVDDLSKNDYIEVWVENNTDATNVTFEYMVFIVD